ncbi:MAG: hypothetical protein J7K65_01680 [Planctomycetes bacterium]|nr:hypothetical protein [Planctomycetota bacterium]
MEEKTDKKPNKRLYILLLILLSIFIFALIIPCHCPTKEQACLIVCKTNLKQTMMAVSLYKENDQMYPSTGQWCENIQQYLDGMDKYFICPVDKIGPCSYAMNENIPADANELPPDLVLLFESAPGWNQVGGPDDVVTDRHGENNPGANIAFADGRVEFVKPEDIPNLRWTVE